MRSWEQVHRIHEFDNMQIIECSLGLIMIIIGAPNTQINYQHKQNKGRGRGEENGEEIERVEIKGEQVDIMRKGIEREG